MSNVVPIRRTHSIILLTDTARSIRLIQDGILKSKMTYTQLAAKAQLSNSTVSNIAIGHTRFPRHETIIRLMAALGWRISATKVEE